MIDRLEYRTVLHSAGIAGFRASKNDVVSLGLTGLPERCSSVKSLLVLTYSTKGKIGPTLWLTFVRAWNRTLIHDNPWHL